MNYKINPTPRDFSNSQSFKLTKNKNQIIINGDSSKLWKIIEIKDDKIIAQLGNETKTFDKKGTLAGAKVFNGNSGSSKSKTDADIISEFGTPEQQKDYAGALVDKGKAEADRITAEAKIAAKKATLEHENLERQMERARKRAELPGKAKKAVGNFINDAAVYGHEHDAIMKAAKQIENEDPQFGNAQWVAANKRRSKTNSQILAEASNKVDSETAKYNQSLHEYQAYQKLLEKSQS